MSDIEGLFLCESEEAMQNWPAIQSAAQNCHVELLAVTGTTELIAAVIPMALRKDTASWLVLYQPGRERELLVVPYPDKTVIQHLLKRSELHQHAARTMEEIRGDAQRPWFANSGFSNLSRLKARGPVLRPLHIGRFQVVSIETPLDELREQETVGREGTRLLRRVTDEVREQRGSVLARLIEEDDPARRTELLTELEEYLASRNLEVSKQAVSETDESMVSKLGSVFGDLLDPESMKFLTSSEVVKRFALKNLADDFDYSLPASGLWKTVERELNLSLVWFLRIRRAVADIHSPWGARRRYDERVEVETGGGRFLNLNEHDGHSGRLRGVMLGPMQYMLRSGLDNDVSDDLMHLGSEPEFVDTVLPYILGPKRKKGSLPSLLQQVGDIRNRHAHVEAMPWKVFQQLEEVVLSPKDDPWSSHLGRILRLKRRVLDYVERTRRAAI